MVLARCSSWRAVVLGDVMPGRCASTEPGISRFRVWCLRTIRNDSGKCGSPPPRASRRDDLLALLAQSLDTERHDVADVEVLRRLHAGADAGRRASGQDVAGKQRHE